MYVLADISVHVRILVSVILHSYNFAAVFYHCYIDIEVLILKNVYMFSLHIQTFWIECNCSKSKVLILSKQ